MRFLDLINFFDKLDVSVQDVTTEMESQNNQKVVVATYLVDNKRFVSKKLYYIRVIHADSVKNAQAIEKHFGGEVYWLDNKIHEWPQPKGETDIDDLIINDITDDPEFKKFLLQLANNNSTGAIQKITKEGRSSQYYRNFENNNHWHDIVLLIKAIIKDDNLKRYLAPLVFKWDGNKHTDRLRVPLSEHFGKRLMLFLLKVKIRESLNPYRKFETMNENLKLLKYKKQIILQGPPGTGKTRLAKELARSILVSKEIVKEDILSVISQNTIIPSSSARTFYTVTEVKENEVIYERSSTKEFGKVTFLEIQNAFLSRLWLTGNISNGNDTYSAAMAKFVYDNLQVVSQQSEIIQFHPSYTYEDFVRGISAKTTSDGKGVVYETENRIFGRIIEDAQRNLKDSQKDSETLSYENWVETNFDSFIVYLKGLLSEPGSVISLTEVVNIVSIEDDALRYKGRKGWSKLGNRMLFDDVITAIVDNNQSRQDIKKNVNLSGLAKWHASYYIRVVDLFHRFVDDKKLVYNSTNESLVPRKEYVLIIDEINRANLSSVLGELIYALEYRNEGVRSIYSLSDSDELIIPENLYIIGTMNTADRSVSQIDYAIRRRFAFVDVLPEDLTSDLGNDFDSQLFQKVQTLFKNQDNNKSDHLTDEFKPEHVQLGHSYFIKKDNEGGTMDIRWKYEIKPILKEYVKD
ncbi:MAG: AAA family ATPase, partial [Bacteroidota bacterium]